MQVSEVPTGVRFYDHRGKRIALLPPGSVARKQAEKVVVLHGKGSTYRDIAERMGLGLSTVHRLEHRLALTLDVEAGNRDKEIKAAAGKTRTRSPQARSAAGGTVERRTGHDRRSGGYAQAS